MHVSRKYCEDTILVFLLCFLLVQQSVAQQPLPPKSDNSDLAKVSDYLNQSDKALACDPVQAESLAREAQTLASQAHATDRLMIDAIGELKSEGAIKIESAQKRHAELSAATTEAGEELKKAHPASASQILDKGDSQRCFAGFGTVRAQIAKRVSQAQVLVLKGDALIQRQSQKAVNFYHKAEAIDAEYPGLAAKIASSQDIEHHKVKGREGVVVGFVVLAALVVGLIYLAKTIK
jgi:hypothetical protein